MTTSPSNPNPPRTLDEQLELYVEGLLTPSEVASFEAAMRSDASLRVRVTEARVADQAIRAAFPAPTIAMNLAGRDDRSMGEGAASARTSVAGKIGPRAVPRWVSIGALAAALALATVAWFALYPGRSPSDPFVSPGEVYARLVKSGFEPEFICTTDDQFKEAVANRFGQPLLIAASPDIQLLGWAYSGNDLGLTLSRRCLILLATVRGERVVMLMDRLRDDRALEPPEQPGMNLYRGVVDGMVVYEISPFAEAVLIPRTFNPDASGPPALDGAKEGAG